MSQRLTAHYQLNTKLSLMSDQRLLNLLSRSNLNSG